MEHVDLAKTYRQHYTATAEPGLVKVPERAYLMIDGHGDPNSAPAYADALNALYPLSYGLRQAVKEASGIAYKVMPLEGLWWVDDLSRLNFDDKSDWRWTMMISQPDEVTDELAAAVLPAVTAAKGLTAGSRVRRERFGDGTAAQVLHRGPYAQEAPTIARLHRFIADNGWTLRGRHHEIYLSDPRRTAPERLRTILRQPILR